MGTLVIKPGAAWQIRLLMCYAAPFNLLYFLIHLIHATFLIASLPLTGSCTFQLFPVSKEGQRASRFRLVLVPRTSQEKLLVLGISFPLRQLRLELSVFIILFCVIF